MESLTRTSITVQTLVHVSPEKAWTFWTAPEHITRWNHANDDWHTTSAQNDLRQGGSFSYRMEAKDGSFGFDFGGTYDEVSPNTLIAYTLGDGRKVRVDFRKTDAGTEITETFEAEDVHPIELQQSGWKAILDSFRRYAETAF
jgi:uncharacterized protein YndB with AHSA1/START domain